MGEKFARNGRKYNKDKVDAVCFATDWNFIQCV
jgi:hypothetical protein